MGPSFENFREIVDVLLAHNALRVVSAATLAGTLVDMARLTSEKQVNEAQAMGERGREVFEAQAGATARTVRALVSLLEERVVRGR